MSKKLTLVDGSETILVIEDLEYPLEPSVQLTQYSSPKTYWTENYDCANNESPELKMYKLALQELAGRLNIKVVVE